VTAIDSAGRSRDAFPSKEDRLPYPPRRSKALPDAKGGHDPARPLRPWGTIWIRLFLALSVGFSVLMVPVPASALPSETPDDTWHVNGPVRAIARYGNTIFLGGQFTQLREKPLGVGGGRVKKVRNLAAINANTGGPAGGVNVPRFAGPGSIVYALTVADGKLWIGGSFSSAGGRTRKNLASINANTGSLTGFSATMNGTVWALADDGSRVYAGGKFTTVRGHPRKRLAAFSLNGTLHAGWRPSANNKVQDMAVTPDKTGLFITGLFTSASDPGGPTRARNRIARLSTSTGKVHGWVAQGLNVSNQVIGMGVYTARARVYWSVGGPDWVAALNINTGARVWKTETDGTVDDAVEMDSRVIIGGHFHLVGRQPGGPGCATSPEACVRHLRLAALRMNGVLDTSWDPKLHGQFGGVIEWEGARRFLVVGERLWVVGEFIEITDIKQNYFGRLS
jgi:beta-propeller uncharacterized protein DUF5122